MIKSKSLDLNLNISNMGKNIINKQVKSIITKRNNKKKSYYNSNYSRINDNK